MKNLFTFLTLISLTAFVYAQSIEDKLVNRLVEYAQVYTQSEYDVDEVPSTEEQFSLALLLAEELESLGAKDVKIDEHSYAYATIPGNVKNAPTLFISAHLDTSPDLDLQGKTPIPVVHEYNGGDLVINEKLNVVLTQEKNEFLKDAAGGKVITSDGTTLLGGDDKAGMSVVMTIAETLLTNPSIPHGDIRIIFTPDEEIGNSTKYLTKKKIAADFGLVVDSHGFGRIVVENFNATDYTFIVKTPPAGHPGYSSKVSGLRIANNFANRLPEYLASFNSSGKKGYMDYHKMGKNTDGEDVVYGRLRSFSTSEINKYKNKLRRKAKRTARKYNMDYVEINNGEIVSGGKDSSPAVVLTFKDSYFNSKNILEKYPTNYKLIEQAYKEAGVKMRAESGRGGSDAGDITYFGIPTYNIFAGSHNEHSNDEWVSSKQMLASYNVISKYIKLMGQQDRLTMLREGNPRYTPEIPELDMNKFEDVYQKISEQYGNSFSNIK